MCRLFYVFLGTIFLNSCSNHQNKAQGDLIQSFPIERELQAEKNTIPPIAMSPYTMLITGDKLIVFSMSKDTIFDVFRLPECKYLYSSGTKGGGPNDYWDLNSTFYPTEKGFQVLFEGNKVLKSVVITDSVLYIDHTSEKKLDIENTSANGFMQLDDSHFIYWTGMDAKTEFNLLNTQSNKTTSFSKYPDWEKEQLLDEDKLFTYLKVNAPKIDGTKFCVFYAYFKRFRIFDNNGNLLTDKKLKSSEDLEKNVMERMIYYYAQPSTSEKYIYAFCKNAKRNDETFISELHVFTWEGEPVALYKLNENPKVFVVSEAHKKLYAINDEEEDCILTYDLSEILK